MTRIQEDSLCRAAWRLSSPGSPRTVPPPSRTGWTLRLMQPFVAGLLRRPSAQPRRDRAARDSGDPEARWRLVIECSTRASCLTPATSASASTALTAIAAASVLWPVSTWAPWRPSAQWPPVFCLPGYDVLALFWLSFARFARHTARVLLEDTKTSGTSRYERPARFRRAARGGLGPVSMARCLRSYYAITEPEFMLPGTARSRLRLF